MVRSTSLLNMSLLTAISFSSLLPSLQSSAQDKSSDIDAWRQEILTESGVTGGLAVHIGDDIGERTASLGKHFLVQGLTSDKALVRAARDGIQANKIYGTISIDTFDGTHLPYIDNLVNLIVVSSKTPVPAEELKRVLAPQGVALVHNDSGWTKLTKPRPDEIDEWTHYLYDASNNAVAKDELAGPPRGLQWVAGPRFSRHHDKMSSISAMVSSNGRVFKIMDEAPRFSILLPPQWNLIARDAFNGALLWKRRINEWHTHLWPLKSGPAQLPRRLVAVDKHVYATLDINGPVHALDAATGKTIRTYPKSKGAEEIIYSNGSLFVVIQNKKQKIDPAAARRRGVSWKPLNWRVVAFDAASGDLKWEVDEAAMPNTLAVSSDRVVFHNGQKVVCVDRETGANAWKSNEVPRGENIPSFYSPTLVLYNSVILFSGGEQASKQTGGWYRGGKDTMTALDIETGNILWNAPHPPSGYRSAEDILVVDGLVWTGETTSGRAEGLLTGRDPKTGDIKRSFKPNVDTYWFHHRCYRAKGTDKFLLMSRTGVEFVDVKEEDWDPNHFVRGACLYGVMPANGLLYTPQHPCACYMEAKLSGFNALAPQPATTSKLPTVTSRIEKGPAFGVVEHDSPGKEDWPTYRHDGGRTGQASTSVPSEINPIWKTEIGGKLSAPIVVNDIVYVASIDSHTVHALNAVTGEQLWQFTAGGRVDSPPTWHGGRLYFGSADGWIYSLNASNGELAWRFLAATSDRRTVSFDQLESLWPVHGTILVHNDILYCVSGRSMFLDGGLRFWRLNPLTGAVISETSLDNIEKETGKDLQDYVSWLNMPVGLPDILSTDGSYVFMRSQPFDMLGNRLPLEKMNKSGDADRGAPDAVQDKQRSHLFSPSGFLDDSWWHRSYWVFGSTYVSGWQGYYRAGKTAPAGRLLVQDDNKVYGFGRKPKYWKWTTPLEHHLFAASKDQEGVASTDAPTNSVVQVPTTKSLNIRETALTFEAWIHAEKPNGVVIARGGNAQGISLFIEDGRPQLAIRVNKEVTRVEGSAKVTRQWVHLVGVLTDKAELRLYVDGQMQGSAQANALIANDPNETMQIGADERTTVGNYGKSHWFAGMIDQVRVYSRALSDEEVAEHAKDYKLDTTDKSLALAYDFEDGKAADLSTNNNEGKVVAAPTAPGRTGQALFFAGGTESVPGFNVDYSWTTDIPLNVRALILCDKTLFAAGPEDLLNEEELMRKITDPDAQRQIKAQTEAWANKRGAVLWAASIEDGARSLQLKLDTQPVFDGLVAARGRLFMAGVDGTITCIAPASDIPKDTLE